MKPPNTAFFFARRCNARICERFSKNQDEEMRMKAVKELLCKERKERLRPRGAQPVQKMKILS